MAQTPITPYPLAMVICDLAWRDPATGKSTLLGCFSAEMAPTFPLSVLSLGLYVAITDGRGKIPVRIRIIDVDEDREAILDSEVEVEFTDPRMIMEICLNVPGVTFPDPGEYRCQAFANNEFLMERRILAIKAGDSPDAGSENQDKGPTDEP